MNNTEKVMDNKMCAIRNKKTNKWVYGTDFRYDPTHQRTSNFRAITYANEFYAESDFKHRQCSQALYEIVPVELKVVEKSDTNTFGIMICKNTKEPWKMLSPVFNSREEASDFFRENLDKERWLFRIVKLNIISQNMLY